MKLRLNKLLFALALTWALLACAALADAMFTIEPTDVYSIDNGKTTKLGTLKAGVEVEVVAKKGGWAAMERGGKIGFAKLSSLVTRKQVPVETRYTRGSAVLYDSFVKGAKAMRTVPEGEAVYIGGKAGSMYWVKYGGEIGWMKGADLTRRAPEGGRQRIGYAADNGARLFSGRGKVVQELDKGDKVLVVAKKGSLLRVLYNGRVFYMLVSEVVYEDPTLPGATPKPEIDTTDYNRARGSAQAMDWWTSDIQNIFARGVICKVTDVETGLCWWEVRYGGHNHADCQPLTAKDTKIMKKAYGGKWSWDRRAIFVTIDGVNYAASMNGMPHGQGSIKNNKFSGHHCIHFTNSRTHGTNRRCPLHQAAIRKAAETVLP